MPTSPSSFRPELLAPAGNLDKLKTACLYGADAVYAGGTRYGLRSGADNLTQDEIRQGVQFANDKGVKVYITCNAFLHDQDLEGLAEFAAELESIGVAALIVSDLGVMREIRKKSNIALHLSTQASCLNSSAVRAWQRHGVTRVVTGRELTIHEAGLLKNETGCEVEMFIHGAMCSAYSGQCTISNYTAGRDSNRGGCKQSCRFEYDTADGGSLGTLLSSRDLNGLQYIREFTSAGIDSLKIEGRMKSSLYIASTVKAYRAALQGIPANGERLLTSLPHRGYTSASLMEPAGAQSISSEPPMEHKFSFLGEVLQSGTEGAWVQLRNPLRCGDSVEMLTFHGADEIHTITDIRMFSGKATDMAQQNRVVLLPQLHNAAAGMILRKAGP